MTTQINSSTQFISVPGGKVWCKRFSPQTSTNKLPLIVVHGGPGGSHHHLIPLAQLANEREVIFYDQLGSGLSRPLASDYPKELWQLPRFVEELETVHHALQFDTFHLLGQSWGGAIAIDYTLKYPSFLQSLMLCSPLISVPLWKKDSQRLLQSLPPATLNCLRHHEQMGTTDDQTYKDAAQVFYKKFVCRLDPWPEPLLETIKHFNSDIYKTMWGATEFNVFGNLSNYDRVKDLKNIKIPTLITCGRYDESTPETMQICVEQLSDGKLIIFENSAHVAHLEEPDLYLKQIRLFLEETS